ncbi:MAG: TetR/AcrR family transcriptional regulator [Clostridia bacterium]|nr:TetR/AcrR family transcriptional regulator [Clostridia bacterium]MBR5427381.1 TetR/AcrR family transcriptional regulator [Clostridia bacterium]
MANNNKNPIKTGATRKALLEASYALFTQKNIESVSMSEAAEAAGYGVATMYRYFKTKPELVVAVAVWKFEELMELNRRRRPSPNFEGMTAAQVLSYYFDVFLNLYRDHRDALRFNQSFNIFIRSQQISAEMILPFRGLVRKIGEQFQVITEKAALDGTVRTDVPGEKMFRTTLHLMLAVVTRYAVGLIYQPESEEETLEELETLKYALLRQYVTDAEFPIPLKID